MSDRAIIALLLAALTAGGLFWFFRPPRAPDYTLVEPRLTALREPYQSIKSHYFYDGGSIGLVIKDADGKIEEFAVPSHLGNPDRYKLVLVGADYDSRSGAIPVAHPEATKQALIVILTRYSHGDPALDWAVGCLSDRASDHLKVLRHKMRGAYKPSGGSYKPQYSSLP